MDRNVKYASGGKPVLSSDQKEEERLLRTKDSFEKINIFLISMYLASDLLPFRSISVK